MMRIRIMRVGFMHKTANWWTCMRRGELLGLRRQDLREMERTGKIHIRQQYARGRDDNGVKRLRLKPLRTTMRAGATSRSTRREGARRVLSTRPR